jgi:putative endonuclease
MLNNRVELGKLGEEIAAVYCRKIGYSIIARHFTSRFGEIDIVAKDGRETVFIEVKTRRGEIYGMPEESVTNIKIRRIIKATEVYMDKFPEIVNYRVDVIVVQFHPNRSGCLLRHIKGVGIQDELLSQIDNY